ncbi:MAG: DNA-binding response regulator, OmpR family, contains REC and winged-helix (WHTH) domain [uncultured Sulfurovum sp.]|uniref:DNA-binding response regulator, OmpR family, contains REC and winged-helix (WHTH) domain n=1 Tax=uncultured Sulfurovum sp. TaxID=269237 RepID=A0A6S6UE60_9BACT|nr:MAG: DNA-binding response regulator, OmpR family, contains REC and winged-helix (WHTH) domain [uncultured Sulfurovum sp.]
MHILIIDDNQEILFGLEKLLNEADFISHTADTLNKASKALDKINYDLIILDWLLPDGSGVEFLATLRKEHLSTPVLLLSSKQDINDKVEALDNGADDYLAKPFSNVELLARIRALLRRESAYKKSDIEIENLKVNLASHKVLVDNQTITLTKKEFSLLEFLLLNQKVILTRYQLNEHINPDFDSLKNSNLVDVHIKNLRKKLASASSLIETVRGIGFRIKER